MTVASALRNDWPLALMVVGTLATVAVVAVCIIAVTAYGSDSRAYLAAVLACFGLIKLGVGFKAVRELRRFQLGLPGPGDGSGQPGVPNPPEDPRTDYGGPGRYRIYIAFKFFTGFFAMAAAVFILTHLPRPGADQAHAAPASAPQR